MSIHSIFSGRSPSGRFSSRIAPAPSESIQRRNSFSNDSIGFAFSRRSLSISFWKNLASIQCDSISEPVQIALQASPARIDR